jgi:HEAT repeat protein
MTDQKQVFSFPTEAKPRWVAVDAERITLCERKEKQTVEEWAAQYELSKQVADRIEALKELRYRQAENAEIKKTFDKALNDPFWAVRSNAVAWIKLDKNDKAIADRIVQLGKTDPRPSVRSEAIIRLNGLEEQGLATLEPAKHAIQFDSSFNVISTAISVISNKDPKEALQYAKMLEKEENDGILAAIAGIYSKTQDRSYISFYETKWLKTSNFATLNFVDAYVEYLLGQKDEKLLVEKGEWFYKNALNPSLSLWHRYAATLSVKKLRDHFFGEEKKDKANIMDGYIKTIKSKETDSNLTRLYESF